MKLKFPTIKMSKSSLLLTKKFLLFYLIISSNIIDCGITIFPDHYEHDDEIFTTSQVNGVTNERFYYSIGYFSESNIDYISPKYGITYHPVKCDSPSNNLIYQYNDRVSFFGDINGKPIRDPESTISFNNKIEETKLFQNTMSGTVIICPSPFKLFHNKFR